MTKPDPDIQTKVNLVLKAARDNGLDEGFSLDLAGLLLTDRKKLAIQKAALLQVRALLEQPAHRLLRQGSGTTAEDLRRVLLERIEEWIGLLEMK